MTPFEDRAFGLLREYYDLLCQIRSSRKTSIGALYNTYAPQLDRARIDARFDRMQELIDDLHRHMTDEEAPA